MKIRNRHYNNLIKEIYWWVVERFSKPKLKYFRGVDFAIEDYSIFPCTPEAKRHMKEVHKKKGKLKFNTSGMESGTGEFNYASGYNDAIEDVHKTKGRPMGEAKKHYAKKWFGEVDAIRWLMGDRSKFDTKGRPKR